MTGIVSDDVIVYYVDPTLPTVASLAGLVTFSTLDPPNLVEGSFELTADDDPAFSASGTFACR